MTLEPEALRRVPSPAMQPLSRPAISAAAGPSGVDWKQYGDPDVEPVWYYLSNRWYSGRQPWFFDTSRLPGTKILEENFEAIRNEVLAYYDSHGESFRPNFTPYAFHEPGWKTINLYSYFLRYPEACARFPKTDAIVRSIPGMCLAQIAVLEAGVRLKAHLGDSNALVRSHLGLRVPAGLPDLCMQVGREKRCWEEGRVFAISIAHRHTAWNLSDQHRVVLIVDVFLPEYIERRYEIAGNALAVIFMKWCATRVPALKKLPGPVVLAIHAMLGRVARMRLWAQRRFGV